MESIKIGQFSFFQGEQIICKIGKDLLTNAAITFKIDDRPNRVSSAWICHNSSSNSGDSAPNKYGYRYSWGFRVYDGESTTDGVSEIHPYTSASSKQFSISERLQTFFRFHNLSSTLLLMKYKLGIFDEYNIYDFSENEGFIKLCNEKKSVEIKFGRFVKQMTTKFNELLLNPVSSNLDDSDKFVESLHNKFMAYQKNDGFDIDFLSGEDILIGYTRANYLDKDGGTLHNSCMNDKHKFLNIYTKNPNQIRLAIIKIDDKIACRCLIWKTVEGKEYADRIYYKYDWMEPLMRKRLDDMGIPHISKFSTKLVQLEKWEFDYYPYLDHFYNFDKHSGSLLYFSNSLHTLRNTNGAL